MPNRTIDSNYPQTAKVQIYGSDSNSPLASNNGLLAVSLSETPTVLVGNRLIIASIPPVSLSGTPTVAIRTTSTLPITILNDLQVRINGHESTFVPLISSTFNSGTLNVKTPGTDVSRFSDYSYAIETIATGTGRYVIQPQLATLDLDTFYFNNGNPVVLTLPAVTPRNNFVVTNNDFSRYSRVAISGNSNASIGITVVFQGQY